VLVEEGRQTLTGYAAGARIRVAMVERLAMRFEILDVVAKRTLQTTDGRDRTHNLLLTAGLTSPSSPRRMPAAVPRRPHP
jgi:hypothetical protein